MSKTWKFRIATWTLAAVVVAGAFLVVGTREDTAPSAEQGDGDHGSGVVVQEVGEGFALEKAGLLPGDMNLSTRAFFGAALIVLISTGRGGADPPARTLDLATVAASDERVRWVYGAVGAGDQGVPVAGGLDCDGDGWRDYAVAYFKASPRARRHAGEVDLVFGDGTFSGFVDTAFVDPGFLRITGAGEQEAAGAEIRMADVTGDGLGDLLVGRLAAPDAPPAGEETGCRDTQEVLCLGGGRFRVEVDWRDFDARPGSGKVAVKAADSGLFWFFSASNWELLVKVLDGCDFNGHFWVFSAATTNVEYALRVTDTRTGVMREYLNPLGVAASAVTDNEAFATCP